MHPVQEKWCSASRVFEEAGFRKIRKLSSSVSQFQPSNQYSAGWKRSLSLFGMDSCTVHGLEHSHLSVKIMIIRPSMTRKHGAQNCRSVQVNRTTTEKQYKENLRRSSWSPGVVLQNAGTCREKRNFEEVQSLHFFNVVTSLFLRKPASNTMDPWTHHGPTMSEEPFLQARPKLRRTPCGSSGRRRSRPSTR